MQGSPKDSTNNLALVHVGEPSGQSNRPVQPVVAVDRRELMQILSVYGRKVGSGEWRDYAISFLSEVAVFSVFRRASEQPLYRIEKRPKMRDRQGMYSVVGMDGRILRRGHDLKMVLRVLEKKLIRSVDLDCAAAGLAPRSAPQPSRRRPVGSPSPCASIRAIAAPSPS